MPRAAGQIDAAKGEAILDAAAEALAERGLSASMEDIARRAGVSKQTVYNQFGCKLELLRAMVERRRRLLAAPFEAPGAEERPEETLAAYARSMLEMMDQSDKAELVRAISASAVEHPELARAYLEAGPMSARRRLAEYLELEMRSGRLLPTDALRASEMFHGMVLGGRHLHLMMGQTAPLGTAAVDGWARDCAARFMRAYGPA